MTLFDRIPCSVIGCRRGTRKFESGEIICRDHFRLAPPATKGRFRRITRAMRDAEAQALALDTDWVSDTELRRRVRRLIEAHWRCWRLIVAQAGRRAGGLA